MTDSILRKVVCNVIQTIVPVPPQTTPINLLPGSEQFNNATYWTHVFGETITGNVTVAPNGTTTADLYTPTAGSDIHEFFAANAATTLANTNYTCSLHVKAGGCRYVLLTGSSFTINNWYCAVFDLLGPAVTQTSAGSSGTYVGSSITSVPNGFYRISVSGRHTLTDSFLQFAVIDTGTPTLTTDYGELIWTSLGTETCSVWGSQLEIGSSMGAYVPTST